MFKPGRCRRPAGCSLAPPAVEASPTPIWRKRERCYSKVFVVISPDFRNRFFHLESLVGELCEAEALLRRQTLLNAPEQRGKGIEKIVP